MRSEKYQKARMLKEKQRVQCEGQIGSSIYFKVRSSDQTYSVIFRGPSQQWLCDCKYFVMKAGMCSHVLACKLWLKDHESEVKTKA